MIAKDSVKRNESLATKRLRGNRKEHTSGTGKRIEEWCVTKPGRGGPSLVLGNPQRRGHSCLVPLRGSIFDKPVVIGTEMRYGTNIEGIESLDRPGWKGTISNNFCTQYLH